MVTPANQIDVSTLLQMILPPKVFFNWSLVGKIAIELRKKKNIMELGYKTGIWKKNRNWDKSKLLKPFFAASESELYSPLGCKGV